MWEGRTGGASDMVKAEVLEKIPGQLEASFSNLPHPRVNKTKQHPWNELCTAKLREVIQSGRDAFAW